MRTAIRSAAVLALLVAGCNGILGLDPLTGVEGSGGATSSAISSGSAATSTAETTGAAGGGGAPAGCTVPGPDVDGQRIDNPGFEGGDGAWTVVGLTLDVAQGDDCEGQAYAHLTHAADEGDLYTQVGTIREGQCIDLSFDVRADNGNTTFEAVVLTGQGDTFRRHIVRRNRAVESIGVFEHVEARCWVDLADDDELAPLQLDLEIFLAPDRTLDLDAVYLAVSDCEHDASNVECEL